MRKRAIVLAVVLAIGQLTVLYIKRGYTIGEVTPPARDLASLPLQLGNWTGVDVPLDERLQQYLQARVGIDRVYTNHVGEQVAAHVVWTDDYIKVHFPEQCYRESGWEHIDTKSLQVETESELQASTGDAPVEQSEVQLEDASGREFPAKLLVFERDGRRTQVLYWFQMGDEFFFDRLRHRTLRRKVCWGNSEWPPLVKVMLESQTGGRRGENQLKDIATHIFAWMHKT